MKIEKFKITIIKKKIKTHVHGLHANRILKTVRTFVMVILRAKVIMKYKLRLHDILI